MTLNYENNSFRLKNLPSMFSVKFSSLPKNCETIRGKLPICKLYVKVFAPQKLYDGDVGRKEAIH